MKQFRATLLVALSLVFSVAFGQSSAATAREFADGFRGAIGGRAVDCPPPLSNQGAACFTTNLLVSGGQRMVDSVVGDLPGVRFTTPWLPGQDGDTVGRGLSYRQGDYAVYISTVRLATILIVFVPL